MLLRSPRGDARDKIPECQDLVTKVPGTFHSSLWTARGSSVMTYALRPALSSSNTLQAIQVNFPVAKSKINR